jgi:hypothetical protein
MHAQDVAARPVEPREDQERVAHSERIEGARRPRLDLEPGLGRALGALPGRLMAPLERRADDADRPQDRVPRALGHGATRLPKPAPDSATPFGERLCHCATMARPFSMRSWPLPHEETVQANPNVPTCAAVGVKLQTAVWLRLAPEQPRPEIPEKA